MSIRASQYHKIAPSKRVVPPSRGRLVDLPFITSSADLVFIPGLVCDSRGKKGEVDESFEILDGHVRASDLSSVPPCTYTSPSMWTEWRFAQHLYGKLGLHSSQDMEAIPPQFKHGGACGWQALEPVPDKNSAESRDLASSLGRARLSVEPEDLVSLFESVDTIIDKGANPLRIAVFAAALNNWRLAYYLITTRDINVNTQIECSDFWPEESKHCWTHELARPFQTLVTRCLRSGVEFCRIGPAAGRTLIFHEPDYVMFTELIWRGADTSFGMTQVLDLEDGLWHSSKPVPGLCIEARKTLVSAMLENGAEGSSAMRRGCPRDDPKGSSEVKLVKTNPMSRSEEMRQHARQLNEYAQNEFIRLQRLKFTLLATVRGVVLPGDICDIIFDYLPWFSTVPLLVQQQDALELVLTQREQIVTLETKLRSLSAWVSQSTQYM